MITTKAALPINITHAFAHCDDPGPGTVAGSVNGQAIRLVSISGGFDWHCHRTSDQMFLVWRGTFRVELRNRAVTLSPGDLFVIPKGVEHRTIAKEETQLLVVVPSGEREHAVAGAHSPSRNGQGTPTRIGSRRRPWRCRSGDCDFRAPSSFPLQAPDAARRGPRLKRSTKLG